MRDAVIYTVFSACLTLGPWEGEENLLSLHPINDGLRQTPWPGVAPRVHGKLQQGVSWVVGGELGEQASELPGTQD